MEQLESIAKKEALKYTKDNKVNALAIGFYEDEKNIGKGYDMGRVEYVPNGEWSDAINIQSGDYSNFKFVNHLEESISLKLPKGTSISEDIVGNHVHHSKMRKHIELSMCFYLQ